MCVDIKIKKDLGALKIYTRLYMLILSPYVILRVWRDQIAKLQQICHNFLFGTEVVPLFVLCRTKERKREREGEGEIEHGI